MMQPNRPRRRIVAALCLLVLGLAMAAWQARFELEALAVHTLYRSDEISPRELKALLDSGQPIALLDVREPWEWEIVRLPGARLTPITHFEDFVSSLDPQREIVLYCRQGVRSMRALKRLRAAGFQHVRSLAGGISRWATEIDPSLPRY